MNEKLKERLMEQLENNKWDCSEKCYNALDDIINYYDFNNEDEFTENIYDEVGEAFIYYADAFDYIREQWITDFQDAFNEGFGENVCTIATYYLEQEIWDFVNEHLDFDIEEDEEENEED